MHTKALFLLLGVIALHVARRRARAPRKPVSVNFHFDRRCNYQCGFCFHTAKTSHVEDLATIRAALLKLRNAGMKKINFSGGEPFLQPKLLGEMVEFCAQVLKLESVSIVSNGSLIQEVWMRKYARHVDILAVSCDSFDVDTNKAIGRGGRGRSDGAEGHVERLRKVRKWCENYDVTFKLNTVVCTLNVKEDMTAHVRELKPVRWKVFQCLLLKGENAGSGALRDATSLTVSDEEFNEFVERHRACAQVRGWVVAENNSTMRDSYLILDEHLCFLNCTGDDKRPSVSIRDSSVEEALAQAGFNEQAFLDRSGRYEWTKASRGRGGCGSHEKTDASLEW